MPSERLSRAVEIGKRVTVAMNIHLVFGALIAAIYLAVVRGEDLGRVLLVSIGAVVLSLAFWFALPFGLTFAFPPSSDRLEFPGARKVVWPLIAAATVATIILVLN